MPVSAWIMTIVIGIVLYGGLGWCIRAAVKREREHPGEE
jgi:hypothetical protein